MNSVDNKVVSMNFDNAAFERNMAQTIKSLEGLRKSLDFANAQKSFGNLEAASRGVTLNSMAGALDNISGKFTAMGAIAFGVLTNITHRAVDAGMRMMKALSFEQIRGGFAEYETNMNSIQTILANTTAKGATLTDVTAALDELNRYADKTIYSFSEMARNIGTFTAAGVDLQTSTAAIKGIANLAAVSGSNSAQASTAMYQLSQAISTGTVRLMDWNSVVNAGMGGEVFQRALFETGKAMGTIKNVDMKTTFEEWTAGGNSFRSSLESGWLTGEVLTQTLQGFTGDLTEAQLMSMGYTKDQAAEIMKMGVVANDAATKVKTFHQLVDTVKEAISSGWAQSFQIIIGNFEEAKALFSSAAAVIGKFVGNSADARNELLQQWKDMGGRELLIISLKTAFKNLAAIMKPIREAFRQFFPKTTAKNLWDITRAFSRFTTSLKMGADTTRKVKSIFRGLFAGLHLGWEIVKGIAGLFGDLFAKFDGAGGGILTAAASLGDFVTRLNKSLVGGLKLQKFFARLSEFIKDPITALKRLRDQVVDMFKSGTIPGSEALMGVFDRLGKRFDGLKTAADKIGKGWDTFSGWFDGIRQTLTNVWDYVKTWFSDLGQKLAKVVKPGDFDATVDVINVGLLGGIAAILGKLLHGGFKFDFGNLSQSVTDSFSALTNTLTTMQTNVKANILLKIAGAIGLLTASVLVLSTIDSGALTQSLTAMAVGFGELIGSMAVLTKVASGPKGAASLGILATGMLLLSGAVLILALAAKSLAKLDWNGLAKGMTGVGALLALIALSVKPISENAGGMIRSGLGLIAIAIALNILVKAVEAFSKMSWGEMAKGLAGVAGGLTAIAFGMNLMPTDKLAITSMGILIISGAMNLLALAMQSFAKMSWKEMGKGLVGVAGGLAAIALGMNLMPTERLSVTAGGILIISGALNLMALALKSFAKMSWTEMGKGLAGMAGALLVLGLAVQGMSGAILGATAIAIVSGALFLLSKVMQEFAKLSLKDIGMALLGIAGVLTVLGLAAWAMTPIVPALLALSVALLAMGAGFALFGVGASQTAKAFEILTKAGKAGVSILMTLFDELIQRIPEIAKALAEGLIEFAQTFLDAAPVLIESLGVILGKLLDTVIEMAPKLAETIISLIDMFLKVVMEKAPDVIAAGIFVLMTFLKGIRDSIGEIVSVVVDIITGFLDALAAKVPQIVESVFNLIKAIIEGVIQLMGDIGSWLLPKGLALLQGLWDGLTSGLSAGWEWFKSLPGKILGWLTDAATWLMSTGLSVMQGLWDGFKNKLDAIKTWVTELPGKLWNWLIDKAGVLLDIGKKIMNGLWDGLKAVWKEITSWFTSITDLIPDWKGPPKRDKTLLYENGTLIMGGLLNGMKSGWERTTSWLGALDPSTVISNLDPNTKTMRDRMTAMMTAAIKATNTSIGNIAGFNPTITPVLDLTDVERQANKLSNILGGDPITADLTFNQAQQLAIATNAKLGLSDHSVPTTQPRELKFEQNIYSPAPLSTTDIYRNTRSQFRLAKEELNIS